MLLKIFCAWVNCLIEIEPCIILLAFRHFTHYYHKGQESSYGKQRLTSSPLMGGTQWQGLVLCQLNSNFINILIILHNRHNMFLSLFHFCPKYCRGNNCEIGPCNLTSPCGNDEECTNDHTLSDGYQCSGFCIFIFQVLKYTSKRVQRWYK